MSQQPHAIATGHNQVSAQVAQPGKSPAHYSGANTGTRQHCLDMRISQAQSGGEFSDVRRVLEQWGTASDEVQAGKGAT